ncbi:hypothetical protein [Amantichitinum ursilacus]|uniref:Uncharacterized protein n=1 Tax=Amantichitinum ursilacus TaxID=857265 RepID=A0A0N0XJ68_9NEIS|nr:hypothetical protein [Amantichitinum ursilacus]KPC53021.1 hypothetical protein WG78_11040 [Amantichitinum ursilacus]
MATKKNETAAAEQVAVDQQESLGDTVVEQALDAPVTTAAPGDTSAEAGAAVLESGLDAHEAAQDDVEAPLSEFAGALRTSSATLSCRVLAQCQYGQVNAVVSLSMAEAEAAYRAGLVDPHPDAVAYASSL